MKQKKLVYYFLMIAISLTFFLPVLNLSFTYKNGKITSQSFSKKQLYSTDNFEAIFNYFVYKTFNFSMREQQVVVGKDNFFFLGNGHANIIDKSKGTYLYTNLDIDSWTIKLKKLQDWYEKQGIQFIVAVAPNKHTIYSDKLPDSIAYKEGGTITDDLVEYSLKKDIHILNLKKALREKKEDKPLFFHTDTHWNNYGALIAYINTMGYLNTIYNENYKLAEYNMTETSTSGVGDLINFLKIKHLLPSNYEKNYNFTFKKKSKICYGEISKNNTLKKCTSGIKKTFNQYIVNKNPLNKEKLLYLCDSFGTANTQFYRETFNTVWRLHLAYINGSVLADFIKENKPDVVIYQIVERTLYNNFILEDMH